MVHTLKIEKHSKKNISLVATDFSESNYPEIMCGLFDLYNIDNWCLHAIQRETFSWPKIGQSSFLVLSLYCLGEVKKSFTFSWPQIGLNPNNLCRPILGQVNGAEQNDRHCGSWRAGPRAVPREVNKLARWGQLSAEGRYVRKMPV